MSRASGCVVLVESVRRRLETLDPGPTVPQASPADVELRHAIESGLRRPRTDVPPPDGILTAGSETKAATVLVGEIASRAAAGDGGKAFLHYWLSETVRGWFTAWRLGDAEREFAPGGRAVRTRFQNMVTLGINLRGRSESEFLAAWHELVGEEPVDTASVFGAATACSSFAGPDLEKALRVAAYLGHHAEAVSMTLARLAGVYYGEERLRELSTVDGWTDLDLEASRERLGSHLETLVKAVLSDGAKG